mgnify:FL=1
MKKLIIFDCDGTLVASEHLYNSITAELLNELGYQEYTPELCMELFAGQSWSTIRHIIEDRHQEKLPADLIERYINIAEKRMHHNFDPCPNAENVLHNFHTEHKICVASNGERGNVIKSLEVTNLKKYFIDDHIFTKKQVEHPKPAPDLFIFALEQMNHRANDSVIIEDSVTGVSAAKAANIKVLGYIGSAHDKDKQSEKLKQAGANIIIECLTDIENHI